MHKIFLALAIFGFAAPFYWLWEATITDANILYWTKPELTLNGMLANTYSTGFTVDLLWVVLVFFIWTFYEANRLNIKNVWVIWLLTLVFGMAGPFPLFLYLREKKRSQSANVSG